MSRWMRILCLVGVMMAYSVTGAAQDAPAPADPQALPTPIDPTAPHLIELRASDGLVLRGAYFAPHASAPAVLMLHQLYTTRESWNTLALAFMEAGYNVLAVDLRGYGKTRGAINWRQAQDDTLRWAAWLSQQDGVQSVTMVGSSMGSSLAIAGCAAFSACRGVVALSPGLNYFGVSVEGALDDGIPMLVIYAERDRYPSEDVPVMQEIAGDALDITMIPGRAHGVDMLREDTTLIPDIIGWVQGL